MHVRFLLTVIATAVAVGVGGNPAAITHVAASSGETTRDEFVQLQPAVPLAFQLRLTHRHAWKNWLTLPLSPHR